ncbi:hypothetical protein HYPSUDRAFT_281510 [Hypholoma sublateritium FD-334 SS-4]|uniref:Uncharacterized protein n=1 Tax=Hypholoma sublateritium (strain FD-334 SS-4) TaxID=945553 RepID=A0A0D2MRS6_HYPSF|nr:hypothetical protein HYPSUDRAFT_281510 [Hypholoma sublateritium FD-334 SS-4]
MSMRRKPSIQPVAAEPALLAQATPGTHASRTTNIIAVSPTVGMCTVLTTHGKEMIVQITEEVDYKGSIPTSKQAPVAFVLPGPNFVEDRSVSLFINERHYLAHITHITDIVTHESPPRIDTSYVQQVTTPPFSLSFLTSDTSSHNATPDTNSHDGQEFEIRVTPPDSHPALPPEAPAHPRGKTPSNRTRALTMSTAAKNIGEIDQELFQSFRSGFPGGASHPVPNESPMSKQRSLAPLAPSPPNSSVRPRPTRKKPPSIESFPNPVQRASRMRTTSAMAPPMTTEETRVQLVSGSQQLRPTGFAVPNTGTHTPRRRMHSDPTTYPPQSNGGLLLSRAPGAASKAASVVVTIVRETGESIITTIKQITSPSPKAKSSTVKGKGSKPESTKDIDVWADTAPSLPLPIGLHAAANDPSYPQAERIVSWIPYEWSVATSGAESPQDVDSLTSVQYLKAPPESFRGQSEKSKGKRRAVESQRGSGVVRIPLQSGSGSSFAQSMLSNAESRRISARKDLPPLPSSSKSRHSPSTRVSARSPEDRNEHIHTRPADGAKGLAAILGITPRRRRSASFTKPSMHSTNAPSSSPRTPDTESSPISRDTASPSIWVGSTSAVTPNARVTTIKPIVHARAHIQTAPPPLEQSPLPKRTTETDRVFEYALADDSSTATNPSVEAHRYTTAPSTVRYSTASTDRGSQAPPEGYTDRTNPPLANMLSGDSKGWIVPPQPTDGRNAKKRSSARFPIAKI